MANEFFGHPTLNSPYEYPSRHWELDEVGQPMQKSSSAYAMPHSSRRSQSRRNVRPHNPDLFSTKAREFRPKIVVGMSNGEVTSKSIGYRGDDRSETDAENCCALSWGLFAVGWR
jgi:hypothetical protein